MLSGGVFYCVDAKKLEMSRCYGDKIPVDTRGFMCE
jgi:hypothetical protein